MSTGEFAWLGPVFNIVKPTLPLLKNKLERSEWVIKRLKELNLEPDHPPRDFTGVYKYALVEYAASRADSSHLDSLLELLRDEKLVNSYKAACTSGDFCQPAQIAHECVDELAVGDHLRKSGVDAPQEIAEFTRTFLYVAKRTQTPGEILALLETKQQQEKSYQALRAEIQNLTAQLARALPAVADGQADDSRAWPMAQQMRDWFKVLDYHFEDYEAWEKKAFEWIIRIPVRRGRYDRILIRGVDGEAMSLDARRLQKVCEEKQVDEAWLVAARRISPAARELLQEDERFRTLTFDELIEDDADFSNYLDWLEREIRERKIAEQYVPLACCKDEIDPATQQSQGRSRYGEAEGWIEGCIERWLCDPAKEHISVLGEFGTGKTWFTLHYAWKLLQDYQQAQKQGTERPRLPLVIPLRDYAKAIKVDNIIAGFFFTRHKIRLDAEVFAQLNRMGKLLLIFDGFDEMAARVDRQQMINQFWELAEVVKPGSKVILTCRTEHFPEAREGRALLNAELQASTDDLRGLPAPQFEVLELEKFDDEQIRRVLSFQANEATVEMVMSNPQLLDLARRPVMTELVLEALPDLKPGDPIDLARVYLYAVRRKMNRDIKDERTFTSLADKLFFLCELSWEMLNSDRMSLNYREFPERLRQLFGPMVQEQKDLDHWHYDMMGQTMLIRNNEGDYRPAHRSLLEFFVAYKLAAMLGVMDEDFVDVARKQSDSSDLLDVDQQATARDYSWNEYFQREVDAEGQRLPVAELRTFGGNPLVDLYGALKDAPIAKAVLDLVVPMLNPKTVRETLLPLIQETRGQTLAEAGYFGGNLVKLLMDRQSRAMERADLSRTVIRDVDFASVSLRQTHLAGATLEDVRFNRILSAVNAVAYSPDGRQLAVGDDAGKVQIWEATTGKVLQILEGHQTRVWSVVYSPDGERIASGSEDETLRTWDVATGECLQVIDDHLCGGLDITGVKGLTKAQRQVLRAYGAVERRAATGN